MWGACFAGRDWRGRRCNGRAVRARPTGPPAQTPGKPGGQRRRASAARGARGRVAAALLARRLRPAAPALAVKDVRTWNWSVGPLRPLLHNLKPGFLRFSLPSPCRDGALGVRGRLGTARLAAWSSAPTAAFPPGCFSSFRPRKRRGDMKPAFLSSKNAPRRAPAQSLAFFGPLQSHRRGVSSAPAHRPFTIVHHVHLATMLRAAPRAVGWPLMFL